ncbi:uncharacterized protein RJT20DRAFT_150430 [Scheffersomyces xylosifermentans]|uniref:uncharacterized protein n=1 Tax=Scheffersomyces xylosifermentans TaxID=1304137 RepID=UPI00315DF23A
MFIHTLNPALFDIRLKSPHKNTILLRGNEYECENVPFEGSVKLSIPEDTHVRRVTLTLIGEFNIEFFIRGPSGAIIDQVFDRLCVLKVEWRNLLTSPEGEILFGGYGDKFMPYYKVSSLKSKGIPSPPQTSGDRPPESSGSGLFRVISPRRGSVTFEENQLPTSGVDGTPFKDADPNTSSFLLPKGNYNLPFKVFLPTNVSETVEGLTCGKLLYKVKCTIERGKFEKDLSIAKHIRIIRTLHPQNFNLTDAIDIYNTWPGKIEYNVNLPKKGIAIGSRIAVNMTMVPLAKGLKLRRLLGSIIQHYHVVYPDGRSPEFEQVLGKYHMPTPPQESFDEDKWVINTHYKVPENLKSLSQTCDVKDSIIQVKHRFRISVQLTNKEGHVSELRANLPVCVYISANVGQALGRHYEIEPDTGFFTHDDDTMDVIFKKKRRGSRGQSPVIGAEDDSEDSEIEDNDLDRLDAAPPLYQQHQFDKVYDLNSFQSPLEQYRSQSASVSPLNSRSGSSENLTTYDHPIDEVTLPQSLNFAVNGVPLPKQLDVNSLCKVPTYDEAVENNEDELNLDEPAPVYPETRNSRQGLHKHFTTGGMPISRGAFSMPHSPLSLSNESDDLDSISALALSDTSENSKTSDPATTTRRILLSHILGRRKSRG